MKKIFLILIGLFFTTNAFAIDMSIIGMIASENSSGYICSGKSIGCSSFSSIYKIEKRGDDLYVCESDFWGGCTPLRDIHKITRDNKGRIFICSPDTIGNCSGINALYKINQNSYNKDIKLLCSGNSIGNCSSFNALYKINEYSYDKDVVFVCSGSSIGKCSSFNAIYKFKKEKPLFSHDDLASQAYTCPVNSIPEGDKCRCIDGYVVYDNECVLGTDYCYLTYGSNSSANIINGDVYCECIDGHEWDEKRTKCIEEREQEDKSQEKEILVEQKERIEEMEKMVNVLLDSIKDKKDKKNIKITLEEMLQMIKSIEVRINIELLK